jgi:hypothetical protein
MSQETDASHRCPEWCKTFHVTESSHLHVDIDAGSAVVKTISMSFWTTAGLLPIIGRTTVRSTVRFLRQQLFKKQLWRQHILTNCEQMPTRHELIEALISTQTRIRVYEFTSSASGLIGFNWFAQTQTRLICGPLSAVLYFISQTSVPPTTSN